MPPPTWGGPGRQRRGAAGRRRGGTRRCVLAWAPAGPDTNPLRVHPPVAVPEGRPSGRAGRPKWLGMGAMPLLVRGDRHRHPNDCTAAAEQDTGGARPARRQALPAPHAAYYRYVESRARPPRHGAGGGGLYRSALLTAPPLRRHPGAPPFADAHRCVKVRSAPPPPVQPLFVFRACAARLLCTCCAGQPPPASLSLLCVACCLTSPRCRAPPHRCAAAPAADAAAAPDPAGLGANPPCAGSAEPAPACWSSCRTPPGQTRQPRAV